MTQSNVVKLSEDCATNITDVMSCLVTWEKPKSRWWNKKEWPKKVIFTVHYLGGGLVRTTWTANGEDQYREYKKLAQKQLDAAVKAIKAAK